MYTYEQTLWNVDPKTKTAPAAGTRREHGRGHPRQSWERDEHGEARQANLNLTPNGGPHLDLGRIRLKT